MPDESQGGLDRKVYTALDSNRATGRAIALPSDDSVFESIILEVSTHGIRRIHGSE